MTNYNEGLHLCQITRQGWLETKKEPRRPMLVFAFHVLAEIHYDDDGIETLEELPGSDIEQTARLLIDVNNDVTLNYCLQKLRNAGFASETLGELDLVGREVRCVNRHEHYNGKLYDLWDLALPPLDLRPLDPITPDVARRLDALFGARLKQHGTPGKPSKRQRHPAEAERPTRPEPHTTQPGVVAVAAGNDELPF